MTAAIVQPVNPSRRPATAIQRRLFDFICARRGLPPSYVEIIEHMGWSPNSMRYVEQILDRLEAKGWIRRGDFRQCRAVVPRTAEIDEP